MVLTKTAVKPSGVTKEMLLGVVEEMLLGVVEMLGWVPDETVLETVLEVEIELALGTVKVMTSAKGLKTPLQMQFPHQDSPSNSLRLRETRTRTWAHLQQILQP